MSVKARFETKFMAETNSGCWLWMGNIGKHGYGQFHLNGGCMAASRAAFQLYKGSIPEGMCVCHKCDEKTCVNPEHLFLGTQADNLADMFKKGRQNTPKGVNHGHANLNDLQVISLRCDRLNGLSYSGISRKYGISISVAYKIVNLHSWKHIA